MSLYRHQPVSVPPLGVTLRDYQEAAVESVFSWFDRETGNPLVVLPTGAGKSVVLSAFAHRVWQHFPGERILCVTHVRELIAQNHAAMLRCWPGAPAGIYSAGIGRREHDAPILFCGIQSVHKRAAKIGWTDLVLVDEAHLIPTKGFGMYRSFLEDLTAINPKLKVIGFTATPFRTDTGRLDADSDRMFHGVAYDAGVQPLIDAGYLSPVHSKATASRIDTSNVHVRGGDFVERELEQAAMAGDLVERTCDEIVRRGTDRRSWLVFCCGIEHANTVALVLRARGIECATVFGDTPKGERDAITSRFRQQQLRCVVNVNVLSTGFDAPGVDLIALLRPTMSPGLYVQQVGRGLRIAPGKADCLVLDFAGNVTTHGPIDDVKVKEPNASDDRGQAPAKTCPQCDEILGAAARECACGFQFPAVEPASLPKHVDRPADAPILKAQAPAIERWAVQRMWYSYHEKPGKTPSLRVDYGCGFGRSVSEWVCFEHQGFARKRAEMWWRQRGGLDPVPATVAEAEWRIADKLEVFGPTEVLVDVRGQYPQLRGVVMPPPGEESARARNEGQATGQGADPLDDLPF